MNHKQKFVAFFVSFATLLVFTSQILVYAEGPAKVAILPVKIHAPEKMEYLQAGLMDMLASRIGGTHDVQVLDRKHVAKTFKKFKKDLNQTTAGALAEDLGADYIVSGSVTFFGTGGSIDFKVFGADVTNPPVAVYSLIEDMNKLLPQFSQVVDEINAKAFDPRSRYLSAGPRPQTQQPQATQAAQFPAPKAAAAEPQVQSAAAPVPTETTSTGPKLANIKQEVVQQTVAPSDTSQGARSATLVAPQPPPWKSQKLKHALVSIAVGDLLGDQANVLVAISNKDLLVYRYSEGKLRQLAEIPAGKKDRFIWVSVADINQNGRDEIFVTNQKKLSGTQIKHSSFVLEWDGNQFATLARDVDYYVRVVRIPGEPVRLLGQKSADDGTFLPEIYNLVWKNSNLIAESRQSTPGSADIFNAAMGDIIGQGQTETIMITKRGYLFLMDINGHSIWKSYDHFGSTENYLELPLAAKDVPQPMDDIKGDGYRFAPTEIDDPNVKMRQLASPILLRDLNRDGKLEIIITHNLPTLAQLGGSGHYTKGEILSLSWGAYGMLENWKTDEIEGVITSLQIGDINGDGMEELIVSTIQSGGISSLWRTNKTVIHSYPLRPR